MSEEKIKQELFGSDYYYGSCSCSCSNKIVDVLIQCGILAMERNKLIIRPIHDHSEYYESLGEVFYQTKLESEK